MKETDISCMKYRKSTHLSGLDVAEMIEKTGSCILTIKEAYYDKGIDVAGKRVDGYFISFQEDVKEMMVNSINRKTIAKLIKIKKNIPLSKAIMLTEWVGITIELFFDESIKFAGQEVGGIRVKPISPILNISDESAIKILNESKKLSELQSNWSRLTKQEQALPSVNSLKDKLKTELND